MSAQIFPTKSIPCAAPVLQSTTHDAGSPGEPDAFNTITAALAQSSLSVHPAGGDDSVTQISKSPVFAGKVETPK